MDKKERLKWWLGLIVAILTALVAYLASCTTTHSFRVIADSIENPNIIYQDSVNVSKFK